MTAPVLSFQIVSSPRIAFGQMSRNMLPNFRKLSHPTLMPCFLVSCRCESHCLPLLLKTARWFCNSNMQQAFSSAVPQSPVSEGGHSFCLSPPVAAILSLRARQNKSMIILDLQYEPSRPSNLVMDPVRYSSIFWPILKWKSSWLKCFGAIPFFIGGFPRFHHRADFSSDDISACTGIQSLSFWLARGRDTTIVFMQFQRSAFLVASYQFAFLILPNFQCQNRVPSGGFRHDVMMSYREALLDSSLMSLFS